MARQEADPRSAVREVAKSLQALQNGVKELERRLDKLTGNDSGFIRAQGLVIQDGEDTRGVLGVDKDGTMVFSLRDQEGEVVGIRVSLSTGAKLNFRHTGSGPVLATLFTDPCDPDFTPWGGVSLWLYGDSNITLWERSSRSLAADMLKTVVGIAEDAEGVGASIQMTVGENGPALRLNDRKGKLRGEMSLFQLERQGKASIAGPVTITLTGIDRKTMATLSANRVPSFLLRDAEGNTVFEAPAQL